MCDAFSVGVACLDGVNVVDALYLSAIVLGRLMEVMMVRTGYFRFADRRRSEVLQEVLLSVIGAE